MHSIQFYNFLSNLMPQYVFKLHRTKLAIGGAKFSDKAQVLSSQQIQSLIPQINVEVLHDEVFRG